MARGEDRNRWSDIQRDLLEEILRKLTLVDYLNCRQVCRSWRRIVKDAVATKGTCPPARQFPFVMLLPPTSSNRYPVTLLDITQENNTSYTIPIPQTWRSCFDFDRVFSVQGWLVFQKIYYKENWSYDLLLFCNPVSAGEQFELPHLPLFPGQDFTHKIYVKLVFSTAPPNSSDFVVVVCAILYLPEEDRWRHQLACYKVSDKKWALIPTDQSERFSEFVILHSKLYAMSMLLYKSGSVTVFNLTDSNNITFEKLEPAERIQPVLSRMQTCVLARDGDEILLVVPCKRIDPDRFRVFKLDMMCGSRWIEVDDLGDLVLLMDSAGIQVISVKDINLPVKLNEGNCIIFCSMERDLRVFSLKDKRIRKFPLSQVSDHQNLWFMPSLW